MSTPAIRSGKKAKRQPSFEHAAEHVLTHSDTGNQAKTPEQVRLEFREAGISVAEWARAHDFNRMTVVDVLRGHRRGNFGEAHRVAVALGLKPGGRVVDVKSFNKPAKVAS